MQWGLVHLPMLKMLQTCLKEKAWISFLCCYWDTHSLLHAMGHSLWISLVTILGQSVGKSWWSEQTICKQHRRYYGNPRKPYCAGPYQSRPSTGTDSIARRGQRISLKKACDAYKNDFPHRIDRRSHSALSAYGGMLNISVVASGAIKHTIVKVTLPALHARPRNVWLPHWALSPFCFNHHLLSTYTSKTLGKQCLIRKAHATRIKHLVYKNGIFATNSLKTLSKWMNMHFPSTFCVLLLFVYCSFVYCIMLWMHPMIILDIVAHLDGV